MPRNPCAYVRAAKPSELAGFADVLTRAFLHDPTIVYYGCAPTLVADPANPTPEDEETIRGLHAFQSAVMVRAPFLIGGNADVVVITSPNSGSEAEEKIVAVALWLPPGVTLDLKQAREAARAHPELAITGGTSKVGPG